MTKNPRQTSIHGSKEQNFSQREREKMEKEKAETVHEGVGLVGFVRPNKLSKLN